MSTVFRCYLKLLTFYLIFESCYAAEVWSENGSTLYIGSAHDSNEHDEAVLHTITPYAPPTNCSCVECKLVCIRYQSDQLEKGIENALSKSNTDCLIIEELRLYNIEFPEQTISNGFLGAYSNRVRSLYIGSSNVTDIISGAFAHGIFKQITLENLHLSVLRRNIFNNITNIIESLAIVQRDKPVLSVYDDFLGPVKNQITSLTLQLGLPKITNITASNSVLKNLKFIDLSHNNFGITFTDETFEKLRVVESLDLSYSNIQFLPNYIFSQLTASLKYLNLSNNGLITINHLIFGRYAINENLVIDADGNPWNCSCQLRMEMSIILKYQSKCPICKTPIGYEALSVLDVSMCPGLRNSTMASTTNKPTTRYVAPMSNWNPMNSLMGVHIVTSTPIDDTNISTTITPIAVAAASSDDTILLQCMLPGGVTTEWRKILWPDAQISLTELSRSKVSVSVVIENLEKSYGLMWFSKVVSNYHEMTVNYNQYGLGCIGSISYATVVEDLKPNTAYTFCMVKKDEPNVSPFNCNSLRLRSNVDIIYKAWLTHDMRPTGISLTVLGIVLCCFVGISGVYMLLKHKPRLLKHSKRVRVANTNSQDIIIFHKGRSLEDLKLKEQRLEKIHTLSAYDVSTVNSTIRRSSIASVESNQSYINANLYEVIPAYLHLQDIYCDYENKSLEFESINSYMLPLETNYVDADKSLVSYAKVSPRSKRASNDPLPALPIKQKKSTSASPFRFARA